MREILFRGQIRRHGEKINTLTGEKLPSKWVYGGALQGTGTFSIIYGCDNPDQDGNIEKNPVYTETLGQYTGLKDKNGKRIFEGDILAFPDTGEDGYEYKEGYDFTNIATVCWNDGRWELEDYGDYNSGVMDDMAVSHCDFVGIFPCGEVIGNIHDNPELIVEVQDG